MANISKFRKVCYEYAQQMGWWNGNEILKSEFATDSQMSHPIPMDAIERKVILQATKQNPNLRGFRLAHQQRPLFKMVGDKTNIYNFFGDSQNPFTDYPFMQVVFADEHHRSIIDAQSNKNRDGYFATRYTNKKT